MEIRILTEQEVKEVIRENKIIFREFYINKKVYGYVVDDEIIAMCPVSQNRQLMDARKIYSPFVKGGNIEIGVELLKYVVKDNEGFVIYADFLTDTMPMFQGANFIIAYKQTDLKRYGILWRGVIDYAC